MLQKLENTVNAYLALPDHIVGLTFAMAVIAGTVLYGFVWGL